MSEKYFLFGAGTNGRAAAIFFGRDKIIAFIDNDIEKENEQGIPVVSFECFIEMWHGETVIITALLAKHEIEQQLRSRMILNYYICPDLQSGYFELERIIEAKNLYEYERIGVFPHMTPTIRRIIEMIDVHKVLRVIEIDDIYSADIDLIITEESINETNNQNLFCVGKEIEFWTKIIYGNLKKYKNIYKGKRCFLVGNGPSLRMEDLDFLYKQGEICIGCNSIHKAFENTMWRPDYIVISDLQSYQSVENIINDNIVYFLCDATDSKPTGENVYYFRKIMKNYEGEGPGFSDEIEKGIFGGRTVMYLMLQIACYMGFQEIYLIGVDFSWGEDGRGVHFCEGYDEGLVFKEAETRKDIKYKNDQKMAYGVAKKYADMQGIRIVNATRGGYLEVFERADFESLFCESLA